MALAGFLCVVVLAGPARAQDMIPPPPLPDSSTALPPPTPPPPVESTFTTQPVHTGHHIPTSLVINNQYFDASPGGFRSYLETIRWSNPQLYAQLSPDVDRLESRQTSSLMLMAGGAVVGLATALYGIATVSNCVQPAATDPNFAADAQAWGQCNRDNNSRMATYTFVGAGVIAAGIIGFWITSPKRGDLLDVINKHNRASPEPLHLQIGYDPTHQLAEAGATLTF